MPSEVYMICNAYESGVGHGSKNDGLDGSKTPRANPKLAEAYQIGYDQGLVYYNAKQQKSLIN